MREDCDTIDGGGESGKLRRAGLLPARSSGGRRLAAPSQRRRTHYRSGRLELIGFNPRPDKERKTGRKVSREGKRKRTSISGTPFKHKFWKKG